MSPNAKPLSLSLMYFLFTEFSLRERRGRELWFSEEAFESAALIESEILLSLGSMFKTLTLTLWPTFKTSLGLSTCLFEISETCTKPWIPSATSTKAPKLVNDFTSPSKISPSFKSAVACSNGEGSVCLIDREIRCLSLSIPMTLTLTSWPTFKTSLGLSTCL